eukprot:RCo027750
MSTHGLPVALISAQTQKRRGVARQREGQAPKTQKGACGACSQFHQNILSYFRDSGQTSQESQDDDRRHGESNHHILSLYCRTNWGLSGVGISGRRGTLFPPLSPRERARAGEDGGGGVGCSSGGSETERPGRSLGGLGTHGGRGTREGEVGSVGEVCAAAASGPGPSRNHTAAADGHTKAPFRESFTQFTLLLPGTNSPGTHSVGASACRLTFRRITVEQNRASRPRAWYLCSCASSSIAPSRDSPSAARACSFSMTSSTGFSTRSASSSVVGGLASSSATDLRRGQSWACKLARLCCRCPWAVQSCSSVLVTSTPRPRSTLIFATPSGESAHSRALSSSVRGLWSWPSRKGPSADKLSSTIETDVVKKSVRERNTPQKSSEK